MGDPAPDFSTLLMGETPFTLSAQRGHPVWVIPTAAGCGECMITLGELADVYPAYRDQDIRVVVLDLFPGSSPDVWREMVDYFGEPSFQWGAASDQFIEEYDVAILGMIFSDRPGWQPCFPQRAVHSSRGLSSAAEYGHGVRRVLHLHLSILNNLLMTPMDQPVVSMLS